MTATLGLVFHEERIDGVVVRRGLSGGRTIETLRLSTDEEAGAALHARLRELGVRPRRVHVGIPRRLAVVKVIELPPVANADLRRMVGFELERHLPFPPAEALFGFQVLEQTPQRPVRVLLVATERRVFEQVRQVLKEVGAVPRLVDVAIHSLAVLVGGAGGATDRAGRVVVQLEEHQAELAIVRGARLLGSRSFPVAADPRERGRVLSSEIERSLGVLPPEDREVVTELVLTGEPPPPLDGHGLIVRTDLERLSGIDSIDRTFLPALAVALRRGGRSGFQTNLVPDELRPRPFPWPVAVTAGLAAATLLIGLAVPAVKAVRAERTLARLDRAVARIAPDVRRVEQLALAVERARREAEILRSFEAPSVPGLTVLRELTELLPADVWLTSLSADRNGVELIGFAGAASQLIPLLEASPRFERVEFTSPVTKGGDKEQFRLKAGWERPVGVPPAPAAPGRPARGTPAPGPLRPPSGRLP